jgi:hypothetical protein
MKRFALLAVVSLVAVGCASSKPVKTSDNVDFTTELNTNRPGADILNVELKEPSVPLCKQMCAENLQCMSFTYAGPGVLSPAPRCLIKNAVPEAVQAEGYVSGVKTQVAPKAE